MGKHHKFTKQEDEIIKREVRKSPENLSNAFRIAADKIGVPFDVVNYRYYRHLRNKGVCFATISNSKLLPNTKRVNSGKISRLAKTPSLIWKLIMKLFRK